MTNQLQYKNSVGLDEATIPAKFVSVCILAFIAAVSAAVYFYHSMCCDMECDYHNCRKAFSATRNHSPCRWHCRHPCGCSKRFHICMAMKITIITLSKENV
jgi:hypothetical protein